MIIFKKEKIGFDICSYSLQGFLDDLKNHGIKEERFDEIFFEQDYSNCYYESDMPSIRAYMSVKWIKLEHKKDYHIIDKSLILICPFCKKKMFFTEKQFNFYLSKSEKTSCLVVLGEPLNPYIKCCKNYYIKDNCVIEV